jgi:hypothetical protein
VTDERQLDPCHLVVKRVPRHAEIPRGRVDIEPARLDGRTWSRDGFLLFLRGIDGRGDVSRFHGNLSKLSRGVVGEEVGEALSASPGVWSGAALGFSGPFDRHGLKPWQPRISSRHRIDR